MNVLLKKRAILAAHEQSAAVLCPAVRICLFEHVAATAELELLVRRQVSENAQENR